MLSGAFSHMVLKGTLEIDSSEEHLSGVVLSFRKVRSFYLKCDILRVFGL